MTEYAFFPETEFSGFAQFSESAYGLMLDGEIIPITAGATYKILWEGTTYTLEAKELDMDGDIAQYIGNLALLNGYDQTEYPFLFITAPMDGVQVSGFLTSDTTTDSHTLGMTICIEGEEVVAPVPAAGFEETTTAAGDTVYALQVPGKLLEPEVGSEYIVLLDGYLYPTTAAQVEADGGQIDYLGSGWFLSGEGEPEVPFIMAAIPPEFADGENWYSMIATTMTGEEHLIGIYKAEQARLILRDPDGTEQEYPMRSMLEVGTTEGGTVLYSKGEVLDSITIEPNFAAGDMTVSAPDGYLVRSAVIAKPEDCEPENILKGKNIGGIPGELEVPVLTQGRIEPDFSGGDMIYVPGDGNAFSAVTIVKPENLKPENIREGEKVAGVDGGLQAATKDVSTAAEMDALLTEANVGKVYRYTGETTETYISGDIYIVEVAE